MRILYADCNCRRGARFADGSYPAYFTDEAVALANFTGLVEQRRMGTDPMYWAVHLGGRHILAVLP